jgi:hypothetical protein
MQTIDKHGPSAMLNLSLVTSAWPTFDGRNMLGASIVPYTSIMGTTATCTLYGLLGNFVNGSLQERSDTKMHEI